MKISISSFQNVKDLGNWIKGTQVMDLIRQHGRMNFYMYATLVQTLKSDFSCNPMRLNASKHEISELKCKPNEKWWVLYGINLLHSMEKKESTPKVNNAPNSLFVSFDLNLEHWRGMLFFWFLMHWGKEVMITLHYARSKVLMQDILQNLPKLKH